MLDLYGAGIDLPSPATAVSLLGELCLNGIHVCNVHGAETMSTNFGVKLTVDVVVPGPTTWTKRFFFCKIRLITAISTLR